ncbi:MAG: branched-chain amino acid ABC transporter permease [Candidatus Heimdallarchaeota archaeon]|nr:MAG: branched-chain amino acid ABC transporter permease [Candidatus Heimdallarchaeota archaeon]
MDKINSLKVNIRIDGRLSVYIRILMAIILGGIVTTWIFTELTKSHTVFIQNISLTFVYGLAFSILLFLMTSGFFLIFGLADVINFAHGAFFMLGGFLGYEFYLFTESLLLTNPFFADNPYLLSFFSFISALLGATLILGIIGGGIEIFTVRRLYGKPISQILLTVGFLYIILQLTDILWVSDRSYDYITGSKTQTFWLSRSNVIDIGLGIQFEVYRIFLVFFGLILAVILFLIISKTRIGLIIQAGIEDPEMVQALGINTKRMFTLVFIAGAALSGLAGAVAVPHIPANISVASNFLIYAFVIVVIGGANYGRLSGTFWASLIVGFSYTFCQYFLPGLEGVIVYLLMAVVLIFRPGGLTGEAM